MDKVFKRLGVYSAVNADVTVNGSGGHASLGTVTTHVDPINRGVYDGKSGYRVVESVARAIWQAQGGADTVIAVTEAHLNTAAEKIANALYRYSVLDLAAAGSIVVRVRLSDMMTLTDWHIVKNHKVADEAAAKIVELYIDEADFATLVAPAPRLALYALVANALHRHQTEGHNWFTGDTTRKNTPTGRLLGVAGADRTAFSGFMSKNGHDLWHFMDTASMNNIVDGMTGEVNVDLDMKYIVRGDVAATVPYSMAYAASLGTSATDRWPPGTVGISAVILAVPIIGSMFDHISMRVKDLDTGRLTAISTAISNGLKKSKPGRALLLDVRNAMQGTTSIAVGFTSAVNADSAERYASLFSFANRDQTSFESGVLLGKWAKGKDMIDKAVGNRIKALIIQATTSLGNVAKLLGIDVDITPDKGNGSGSGSGNPANQSVSRVPVTAATPRAASKSIPASQPAVKTRRTPAVKAPATKTGYIASGGTATSTPTAGSPVAAAHAVPLTSFTPEASSDEEAEESA
nr:hypothetical protein [Bremia lactucae associated yuevirus-like virus 2]